MMRKLKYILIGVSNFFAIIACSQSLQSNDSNIALLSKADIYYSPNNLLSNISLSTVRFTDKKEGIRFMLTAKQTGSQPSIRTDSILLQSGNKILTISNPYSDTIYWKSDGSLCLSSTHFLNQDDIGFLKGMPVTSIIFIVNGQPLLINTTTKSQRNLKRIANDSY
jgi:hypothetical protein